MSALYLKFECFDCCDVYFSIYFFINSSASLGSPHAPKPAPATNDILLSDVPIQFDLQPLIDDITDVTPNLQGPPKLVCSTDLHLIFLIYFR